MTPSEICAVDHHVCGDTLKVDLQMFMRAGTFAKWICKCSCVRGYFDKKRPYFVYKKQTYLQNRFANQPASPPRNAKTHSDPSTQQQCFGRGFPKSRCTCLGRAAAWSCRLLLRGWEAKPITCSIKATQSSLNGELGELWALGSQKTFKIFARRTWVGPDPHLSSI